MRYSADGGRGREKHRCRGTAGHLSHTNVEVIRRTRELGAVSMPGALTPTEIVTAYEAGADLVKLFPAGELGVGYIRRVGALLAISP